jgi:hypothetical protein
MPRNQKDGDWGLGIGDCAQSPITNPQSQIPNPHNYFLNLNYKNFLINIFSNKKNY